MEQENNEPEQRRIRETYMSSQTAPQCIELNTHIPVVKLTTSDEEKPQRRRRRRKRDSG
jgi:hypothetical protein